MNNECAVAFELFKAGSEVESRFDDYREGAWTLGFDLTLSAPMLYESTCAFSRCRSSQTTYSIASSTLQRLTPSIRSQLVRGMPPS